MATFAGAPVFGSYFLNAQGKPHRSVLITVYEAGTNTKPDLFTDRAKTEPLSNPFNADSLGNVDFLVDGVGEFEALVNGVRVPFTVLPDGLEPVDLDRVTGLTAALAARALDVDLDTEVAARTAAVAAEASARAAAVTAEASARAAADSTLTSNVATNTSAIATNTSAIAGKQPLDSDLTAIAALSTTSFGRNLLALADGAALAGAIPSGTYVPTTVAATGANARFPTTYTDNEEDSYLAFRNWLFPLNGGDTGTRIYIEPSVKGGTIGGLLKLFGDRYQKIAGVRQQYTDLVIGWLKELIAGEKGQHGSGVFWITSKSVDGDIDNGGWAGRTPDIAFAMQDGTYIGGRFVRLPIYHFVGCTNGSATVTDTDITATHQGLAIAVAGVHAGTTIPASTYVGTVTPGVGFLLSSSPSSQVDVLATATRSVTAALGIAGDRMVQIIGPGTATAAQLSSAVRLEIQGEMAFDNVGGRKVRWYGSSNLLSHALIFNTADFTVNIGSVQALKAKNGSVVVGSTGALANSATVGFLELPTTHGAPSGVPVNDANKAPECIEDSSTPKRWVYVPSLSAWRQTPLLTATQAPVLTTERDWTLPTGAIAQTVDRTGRLAESQGLLITGRESLFATYLRAGQTVTSITFVSGTTAASTSSHVWFTLRSGARTLLGITADDTAAAPWSASTAKTMALATPYVVPTSGLYYFGVNVTATTPPTLLGEAANAVITGLAPVLAGADTTNTGLTTPATAPSTSAALAALSGIAYAYAA